jgi:hypothetical protein
MGGEIMNTKIYSRSLFFAPKLQEPHRGIKLLDIQHIGSDGLGIAMAFASGVPGTRIHEPQHPVWDEPAGFVPDRGALQAGLATAFGNGFGKEDNRPENFVVVLDIIGNRLLYSTHAEI